MLVTLSRLLRTERTRLLVLSGTLLLWFLLIMLVVRSNSSGLANADLFGSSLGKGFGIGALVTPTDVLTQLLGVSFNHPIVIAILGAASIALGARSCQGELERGTLDVTLAHAISRRRYLLGYVTMIALAIAWLMAVSWLAMVGFARLLDVPGTLDPGRAALACANGAAVFFAFGAIAVLVSVLLGRRGNAMFVTVGILVVMYAIAFIDRIWNTAAMDLLAPLSLFHWFDPGPTLAGATPSVADFLVPLGAALACVVVALWRFERRDL
jgi:ABC-type transport system involved in multi-copper enzyme maturation permease subunit